MFNAFKLTDKIYWVGAVDYNVRSFHGYAASRGATYNCYLVLDEKVTLIDTVKSSFTDEMMQRISSVIDPSKIDIIISNHAEFDHSGGIRAVYNASKAKVYATSAGVKSLTTIYGDMDYVSVKTGDTLCAGAFNFQFLGTPMVHWPDNMVTYLLEEQILFSNDAFGQHLATSSRLDTNTPLDIVLDEAKKYYANIVLPYASLVNRALSATAALKLKMIAPSHGVIWTEHIDKILELYKSLGTSDKDGNCVVVYDSMWGGTAQMAQAIGAEFEKFCPQVFYADLKATALSDILKNLSTASYLALGSSTMNNTIMPNVAAFLAYAKGLKPTGLKYVTFGTFGWAGGAVKEMSAALDALGFEKLAEYQSNFVPTPSASFLELQALAPQKK